MSMEYSTLSNADKADIVYLQETHLDNTEHKKLQKMGFTKVFFSSHKSKHKRGVAILISNRVSFEKMYEEKDEDGRYVLVRGMIEGSVFTLISVYIPPGSTFSFYKKIIELMITQSKGFLVCGGDLNIHLTPNLDISKQTGSNKAIGKKK